MPGSRRRATETAFAAAALLLLSFGVLLAHVRHGGLYSDDWSIAAGYHFDGWWHTSVDELHHAIPDRPVLAFLHPLPYALFGNTPSYHLAAAAVLAALTSLSFFVFLRELRFEFPHALAMALLATVFPWADATRLWPTGAMNNVAVIAYFAGSVVALRGLDALDLAPRRSIALHLAALLLYLVSVLTYEVAPAAIVLSGLLYRTRASWRALRGRWAADALLVLVVLGISAYLTSRVRHVGSLQDRIADLPHFSGQGLTLFASIFVPPSVSSSWANSWKIASPAAGKLIVLAAASAVVGVALIRWQRTDDSSLRRWLLRALGGACGVVAAYVMFLGSGLVPLFYPGVDDRTNTFAAFGFVVAAYSLVALLAHLVGRRWLEAVIVTAGAVVIAAGFVQRVRADVRRYHAAAVEQRQFIERLETALPRPAAGSPIFTFGRRAEAAPGVPVFKYTWDLRGAVDLHWNDRSLKAVPIYGQTVSCGAGQVGTPEFGSDSRTAYGRAIFVDLPTRRVGQIGSRAACTRARAIFKPGPVVPASPSPRLSRRDSGPS